MQLSLLLLLLETISSQNIQIINRNTTWTSGDINCDDNSNFTGCIINCNTESSCGQNSNHQLPGSNINCLQTGTCTINCRATYSCQESHIYTHSSSVVNIEFFGTSAAKYTEIFAPFNGELHITVSGGDQVFKYGKIYSQQTKSIDLKCDGLDDISSTNDSYTDECRAIFINGSSIFNYLNISCINNGQCENSIIYCPINAKCNIFCSYGTYIGASYIRTCGSTNVYATDGLPYDINWHCDAKTSETCYQSILYCKTGEDVSQSCAWQHVANNWECDGYCYLPPSIAPTPTPTQQPITVSPSIIPTFIPTINPTLIPTLIPTTIPTIYPTIIPTINPTNLPTITPIIPTSTPTSNPIKTTTAESGIVATVIHTTVALVGNNGPNPQKQLIRILFICGLCIVILVCMLAVYMFRRKIKNKNKEKLNAIASNSSTGITTELEKVQSVSVETVINDGGPKFDGHKSHNTLKTVDNNDESVEEMFNQSPITTKGLADGNTPNNVDQNQNNNEEGSEEMYDSEINQFSQTTKGNTSI